MNDLDITIDAVHVPGAMSPNDKTWKCDAWNITLRAQEILPGTGRGGVRTMNLMFYTGTGLRKMGWKAPQPGAVKTDRATWQECDRVDKARYAHSQSPPWWWAVPPTVGAVFGSLLMDASCLDEGDEADFITEFCGDVNTAEKLRQAQHTYLAVQMQTSELRKLLGGHFFRVLNDHDQRDAWESSDDATIRLHQEP